MVELIKTERGVIAASKISRMTPNHAGKAIITTEDGAQEISLADYQYLIETIGPKVPDSTGIIGLRILHDDWYEDGDKDADLMLVSQSPIIAWRLTIDGPKAVTAIGFEPTHYLYRDGTVEDINGAVYDNLDEAKIDAEKQCRAQKA